MEKFAKLLEIEKYGQVLVIIDESDFNDDQDKVSVKIQFKPQGLGICSQAVYFPDTDDGVSEAKKWFNSIDEETAIKIIDPVGEIATSLVSSPTSED